MTSTASFTTDANAAPIRELLDRVRRFAIELHERRARRTALVGLLELSPPRLRDLGIEPHDVIEALDRPTPGRELEARRAANAGSTTP